MYLINHFLAKNISLGTVPDLDALNTTNSEDSIMSDVKGCNSEHSQNPTVRRGLICREKWKAR